MAKINSSDPFEQQHHDDPPVAEATATPVGTRTTTIKSYTIPAPSAPPASSSSPTYAHLPATASGMASASPLPPPGAPPGGRWGRNNYIGEKTGAAALIGCLCFCLPGLLVLLCPFDERDAYSVNGKVYDASGRYIGSAVHSSFVPSRQ